MILDGMRYLEVLVETDALTTLKIYLINYHHQALSFISRVSNSCVVFLLRTVCYLVVVRININVS